jgi:hypothetical protein
MEPGRPHHSDHLPVDIVLNGAIHLLLVETSLHREAGTRTTGASLADVGGLDN